MGSMESSWGTCTWTSSLARTSAFIPSSLASSTDAVSRYGHAAVWGLIPGWTKADGGRNYPVVCMVANLAKPTPTRPALMKVRSLVSPL